MAPTLGRTPSTTYLLPYECTMEPESNITELTKYWPTSAVAAAFDVSDEALRRWRLSENMPTVIIYGNKNPIILFNVKETRAWAERTNRPFNEEAGRAMVEKSRRGKT